MAEKTTAAKPRARKPAVASSAPAKTAKPRVAKAITDKPEKAEVADSKAKDMLKKVSAGNKKNVSNALEMTRNASFRLIDSQRAIWLAGLGALAQASLATGKRGQKGFEALVSAGEALEAQARGAVDLSADRLKESIGAATDFADKGFARASDEFDRRVEQAIDRLGIPKSDAFKQLSDRLNGLSKMLEKNLRMK